jgi:polyhydroxyalkanoate synthesis regulator phasin
METSTPNLTTAAEILAVFNSVAGDKEICSQPESIALLKDLTTLFLVKPVEEIAGCILTDASAVSYSLVTMSNLYSRGSEERKAVVAKGVSLVDEFVKTGHLDAAEAWLVKGYNAYPSGLEERKAVVAKRLSLVDEFVKTGHLDAADAWLVKGYNAYPSGSEERKAVVASDSRWWMNS